MNYLLLKLRQVHVFLEILILKNCFSSNFRLFRLRNLLVKKTFVRLLLKIYVFLFYSGPNALLFVEICFTFYYLLKESISFFSVSVDFCFCSFCFSHRAEKKERSRLKMVRVSRSQDRSVSLCTSF